MAITAATKTSDFSGFIKAEDAAPIFERAALMSTVQRLGRQVPLSYRGVDIPVFTSRPTAGWVSEGNTKPASKGTMTLKTISPKKLAAIAVVSQEVVRANPGGYVTSLRDQLAESFAVAFDRAALHDEGPDGTASGGPFSTYLDQTTKSQEIGGTAVSSGGIHTDLVEAVKDVVSDTDASGRRYRVNGFALDSVLEPALWGAVDTNGRPIYTELAFDAASAALAMEGRLLGRPSFMSETIASINQTDIVGYAGDWTQVAWGVVGGINYAVSTESTVTINGSLVSLWENNLVAVRAEAEYGFICADVEAFSKLTNTNNTPVTSS